MAEVKKYARFYLQMRKKWANDKQKERPVIMWFSYNGKYLCTTTGIKTIEKNWDTKKQRLKTTVQRATEVNRYLDLLEQKVNDIYFKALSEGLVINNRYLLDHLKATEKKTSSFFEEWDKYLVVQTVKLQKSTLKSARTAYNHFKEFCSSHNKPRITFEDITPNLKSEFAQFLLKKGNSNNTIHAVQKRMTRFLNYAKKIGLHNNDTHKEFHIPERVGSIKFLEWEEVKQLIDVKLEPGLENDARDLFVFCCLTAMRYSDVTNLKKTDIVEHKFKELDGVHYAAHIRQQKTDRVTVIPLLPEALDILNKYKNERTEFALPHRANQTVNRIIKQVGRKARLTANQKLVVYRGTECETSNSEKWKILSTHMGRRTFVTIAATRGIPINIACSITGHNPKTMLTHYAGVIDAKKFEEVQKKLQF